MQIEDYEPTARPIDPTPRRPQDIAAAKRAQRQGDSPEPVAPVALPARRYVPFGIGAAVLILLMIGMTSWQLARKPVALHISPTPTQTMARTSVLASAPLVRPTAAPTSAPERTIDAYAAPEGAVLGPIEVTRAIVPVAHYGSSWIQADVSGSGRVWLRVVDWPGLAIVGPDLAPAPPQTGRGLTLAVATPEPVSEPTPEPAATPVVEVLKIRTESDCAAEHGRCDPPCTAEHGRCSAGDK